MPLLMLGDALSELSELQQQAQLDCDTLMDRADDLFCDPDALEHTPISQLQCPAAGARLAGAGGGSRGAAEVRLGGCAVNELEAAP